MSLIPTSVETLLLNLQKNWNGLATLSSLGGVGDGATDNGPLLNTIMAAAQQVLIDVPATAWLMDTTVSVPSSFSATKSLRGAGKSGPIITQASPNLTNGVLFRLNANSDTSPITTFTNNAASTVDDIYISAQASYNNKVGVTGFVFNGSTILRNILLSYVARGFVFGNAYNDLVVIENVCVENQLIVDANSWIIDLLNTPISHNSAGDGVKISGVQAAGAYNTSGASLRCNTIRASAHHQLLIERVLNGDISLIGCVNPIINRGHFENGHTTLEQCQGAIVENSAYYMCNAASINAGTPISVLSSGPSGDSAVQNSILFKNLVFYYLPTSSGNLMMDRAGVPNISFVDSFSVEVEKLLCSFTPNNYLDFSDRGITTGIPAFDNYSHIASLRSLLTNGGGTAPVIDVKFSHGFSAARNTTASLFAYSDIASVSFNQPSGTYYYKAVILYDPKRRIGYASGETSTAVTNGGNAARLYVAASDACQPVMIELYRGAVSGSYNEVLRYPYIDGRSLYDLGDCVNGVPWAPMASGGIEAVNVGLLAGLNLSPGDTAATSDAYGHAEVWTDSNTMPTTGAWRKGDKVWLREPVVTNGLALVGWLRITDCAEAAPSNVPGADWQSIYVNSTGTFSNALAALAGTTDTVTAAMAYAGSGNTTVFASNVSIPANTIQATTVLRVSVVGTVTSSATPPNMAARLLLGGTTVWAANTTYAPGANENSLAFAAIFLIHGTAPSSASAAVLTNPAYMAISSSYAPWDAAASLSVSQTLATNGALVLQPALYCSAGTAGNSVTINQFLVEVVQP